MRKALFLAITAIALIACEDEPVTVSSASMSGEWAGVYTQSNDPGGTSDIALTIFQADGGLLTGSAVLDVGAADVSGDRASRDVTLRLDFPDGCQFTFSGDLSEHDGHLRLLGQYATEAGCPQEFQGNMDLAGPAWTPPDDNITGVG